MKRVFGFSLTLLIGMMAGCKPRDDRAEPGESAPELISVVDQDNLEWDGKNDYGGTLVQTFTPQLGGEIESIRVALEGRENTRELLVTLRRVDGYGFPVGEVLASAVVDVVAEEEPRVRWYEAVFENKYCARRHETLCIGLMPSAIKSDSYGYFEYAYSHKDKYKGGRMNPRGRGRKTRDDDGKDLCFAVVVLASEGEEVSPLDSVEEPGGSVSQSESEQLSIKQSGQGVEQKAKVFDRLTGFMGLRHIPLHDLEGYKVSVWRYTRGQKYREPLVDSIIDDSKVDIFYGLNMFSDDKVSSLLVHEIDSAGGGGTVYSHGFGSMQHFKVDTSSLPIGRAVKLSQNLAPDAKRSFIWIQIDPPEKK